MRSVAIASFIVVLSVSMLFSVSADAGKIRDMDASSDFAKASIQFLAEKNIITGDSSGNFCPKQQLTRAQAAAILARAMKLDLSGASQNPTFKDVPKNYWAYAYIEAAFRDGIVTGVSNDNFKPDDLCTREQIASMFVRALGMQSEDLELVQMTNADKFKDYRDISAWAKAPVEFAIQNELIKGTAVNIISPGKLIDKEQMAVIADRFIKNYDDLQKVIKDSRNTYGRHILLSVNQEVMPANVNPMFKDGEMLMPVHRLAPLGYYVVDTGNGILVSKDMVKDSVKARITFKAGSSDAVTEIIRREFGTTGDYKSEGKKHIQLAAAPVEINGELLVPVKALEEVLGLSAEWDERKFMLSIKDPAGQNFPNLYEALCYSNQYNGSYKMNIDVSMSQKALGKSINGIYKLEGAKNLKNMHLWGTYDSVPYNKNKHYEYDTFDIDGPGISPNIFSKDADSGKWMAKTDYADSLPLNYTNVEQFNRMMLLFLVDGKGYAVPEFTLVKQGNYTINGEKAARYVLTSNNWKTVGTYFEFKFPMFIPLDYQYEKFWTQILPFKNDLRLEFFVNEKNQLVKEIIALGCSKEMMYDKSKDGFPKYEEPKVFDPFHKSIIAKESFEFSAVMDVNFSGRGQKIEISKPPVD